MARGYWIARIDVADPQAYQEYVQHNAAAFEKFGAKFIVRGGQFENPEGSSRQRNVVLEFDSYDSAVACYNSDEYRTALKFRTGENVSTGDLIIVEGVE